MVDGDEPEIPCIITYHPIAIPSLTVLPSHPCTECSSSGRFRRFVESVNSLDKKIGGMLMSRYFGRADRMRALSYGVFITSWEI